MTKARTFLFTSAQRVGSTAILNAFPEELFYIGGPFRKSLGRPEMYTHLGDLAPALAQRYDDPGAFIDDVVLGYPRTIHPDIIFKIEYRSFFGDDAGWRVSLIDHLSGNPHISVIHCYRGNLLERFISMMRMRKTGEVGVKLNEDRVKADPFTVKPKQAVANVARIIEQTNRVHAAFNVNNYHLMRYEDLRDDWAGTLAKVGEFTGVDLSNATPIHQKVIKDHCAVLKNYDDVRRAVIEEFGESVALDFRPGL
jgi:sulfotransferase family protein